MLIEEQLARDRRLLELEERAERDAWTAAHQQGLKALEREGLAIRGLTAKEDKGGPFGRTQITFDRTYGGEQGGFALHGGDPVLLHPQAEPESGEQKAIIRRITPRTLELIFDDEPEAWVTDDLCACKLGPNDVTFQRLRAGIAAVEKLEGASRTLRDIIFGDRPPPPLPKVKNNARPTHNAKQNEALDLIAAQVPLFILHGPPGTGKTYTLAQAIAEAAKRGERVLVGTASNQALDNVALALVGLGVDIVRLGHPARANPALLPYTLEGRIEAHPHSAVAKNLFKEARQLMREAQQKQQKGRALDARQQAYDLRGESKKLIREARDLEAGAERDILKHTRVVLATLTGMRDDVLGDLRFDLGVVDEATQALGPAIYPVVARAERLLLAGDHQQLGPTVLSNKARDEGLGRSWFERLQSEGKRQGKGHPQVMLNEQYRMHADIMTFPSRKFYNNALIAHDSVKTRGLPDEVAFIFIDTAGRAFDEERPEEGGSLFNRGEAALAAQLATALLTKTNDVGLLSPYAAQVEILREACETLEAEVNTIDGFQGREKDAIIVSLVRSNETQDIGFLSDVRRMNVAITRAKKVLIVIGDSATLSGHPFYRDFVDHAIATNAHRSAWDYAT